MIVPFRVIDKLRTWWDEKSDFDLERHAPHAVLYWHGLRAMESVRSGTVDTTSFKYLYEGLYAEWDLWENEAGNACLRLVDEQIGATSTATMPHYIEGHIRKDGYVEKWPLVEVSMLDVKAAGSQPGTTTVYHIRASGLAAPGDKADSTDEIQLIRSQWIMDNVVSPTVSGAFVPPVAPPPAAPPPAAPERPASEQPLRQLPGITPTPVNESIRVASRFDGISAFGMLVWDAACKGRAWREERPHKRSEEFMRALGDKIEHIYRKQTEDVGASPVSHVRAVDEVAAAAWGKVMPYMRANELMKSTVAGIGDELVPTLMSSVAYHVFMLESRVAGLLSSFQLPSVPYDYPVIGAGVLMRRALEATDNTHAIISGSVFQAVKPATSKITFTPGKIGALAFVAKELFEDAGLSVADVMAKEFARRMASELDYVLINGDERTAATNLSHTADPTGTNYDKVLILDGLRRMAQVNSWVAHPTWGNASPVTIQKTMGARGIIGRDLKNLALVVDPGTAYMADQLTTYQTVQNVGEGVATTLNGQLGIQSGIPILVADEIENAAATGLYPTAHTGGTTGTALIINRELLMIGYARGVTMEATWLPHVDTFAMSASVRLDLQQMQTGAVGGAYNITI